MVTEWPIGRPAERCGGCGAVLEAGQPVTACLVEREGELVREDRCQRCGRVEGSGLIGWWRTRVPAREPAPTPPRPQPRTLLHLFETLEGSDDGLAPRLRFVLALMLMRRKVLRLEDTEQRDDGTWWRLVDPATGAEHVVHHPSMSDADVETLNEELTRLLYGDASDSTGCAEQQPAPPGPAQTSPGQTGGSAERGEDD